MQLDDDDDPRWAARFLKLHKIALRGCFAPAGVNQDLDEPANNEDRRRMPMFTVLDSTADLVDVPFAGGHGRSRRVLSAS